MSMRTVVNHVATVVSQIQLGHPVRVAVDGITAAGKTTFADRLSSELNDAGRTTIRVSMDGFHNPRAIRNQPGMSLADSYYEHAYNFEEARQRLLEPLGQDGTRSYQTAIINLSTDELVDAPKHIAPVDSILILDGSFLQKPALLGAIDYVVYLRASFEEAQARGVARDAKTLGGYERAAKAYQLRYHAASRRYLSECAPERSANIVVDVDDYLAVGIFEQP